MTTASFTCSLCGHIASAGSKHDAVIDYLRHIALEHAGGAS